MYKSRKFYFYSKYSIGSTHIHISQTNKDSYIINIVIFNTLFALILTNNVSLETNRYIIS